MRFALLNSRKPRRVSPLDRWVRLTAAAARRIGDGGHTLVAGLGPLTHDFGLFCALDAGGAAEIVLDATTQGPRGSALRTHRAEFLGHRRARARWPTGRLAAEERDLAVCDAADVVVVIEARADGIMERLGRMRLRQRRPLLVCPPDGSPATAGNARLAAAGATTFDWGGNHESCRPDGGGAPEGAGARFPAGLPPCAADWLYVVHFTRTCPLEFPGESRWEFARTLAASRDPLFHRGLRVLERILDERVIRASGRLIRGGRPVVSFTAAAPADVAALARWARHLGRWTFEPYGVGLRREAAERRGLLPVLYGPAERYAAITPQERWRYQAAATGGVDWTAEREWRARGDVELGSWAGDEGIVVVADQEEARRIRSRSPFRIHVLGGDERSHAASAGLPVAAGG
ncbi:MAG: hypothetical protein HY905_26265 [Deltaproteobacteria bacterium]|nr:hypothetical protein [Deltaproteobacteria bacterium]